MWLQWANLDWRSSWKDNVVIRAVHKCSLPENILCYPLEVMCSSKTRLFYETCKAQSWQRELCSSPLSQRLWRMEKRSFDSLKPWQTELQEAGLSTRPHQSPDLTNWVEGMRNKLWCHLYAFRLPEQIAMNLVENGYQTLGGRWGAVLLLERHMVENDKKIIWGFSYKGSGLDLSLPKDPTF